MKISDDTDQLHWSYSMSLRIPRANYAMSLKVSNVVVQFIDNTQSHTNVLKISKVMAQFHWRYPMSLYNFIDSILLLHWKVSTTIIQCHLCQSTTLLKISYIIFQFRFIVLYSMLSFKSIEIIQCHSSTWLKVRYIIDQFLLIVSKSILQFYW